MLLLGQDDLPDPPSHGASSGKVRPAVDPDDGGLQVHTVALTGRTMSAVGVTRVKTVDIAILSAEPDRIQARIQEFAWKSSPR